MPNMIPIIQLPIINQYLEFSLVVTSHGGDYKSVSHTFVYYIPKE